MLNNDKYNLVFIIGAPRSGSTWLQQLVAEHHDVASVEGELTLFSRYIAPLVSNFEQEENSIIQKGWNQGLPLVLKRSDIDHIVENWINQLYSRINKENTKIILDKHPHYSECTSLINYYLPNAKFIDIIRDGREVASSWHRVYKTEGFGASTFSKACSDWKKFVLNARNAEALGHERYLKVFYNNLVNNTESELARIFDFCGLKYTQIEMNEILAKKRNVFVSAPSQKTVDKKEQKIVLNAREKYLFDLIAGDLLVDLGFEKNHNWSGSGAKKMIEKIKFKIGLYK